MEMCLEASTTCNETQEDDECEDMNTEISIECNKRINVSVDTDSSKQVGNVEPRNISQPLSRNRRVGGRTGLSRCQEDREKRSNSTCSRVENPRESIPSVCKRRQSEKVSKTKGSQGSKGQGRKKQSKTSEKRKWKEFERQEQNPNSVFPFVESSGPSRLVQLQQKPIDFFMLFITEYFINMFVEQTNLYCRQSNQGNTPADWQDVCYEEVLAFIGLLLQWDWCNCLVLMTTGHPLVYSTIHGFEVFYQGNNFVK